MTRLVHVLLVCLLLLPTTALGSGPGVQVDALEAHFHDTKPGVATTLTFSVQNTGSASDTFALTVASLPAGWAATPSVPSVTLAPQASAVVTLTVTPQLPVLSGYVALRAASPGASAATGGWVRTPIEVTTLTRDVADGLRNDPQVRGNVTARWAVDGTPAAGATITVVERSAVFGIWLSPSKPTVLAYGNARTLDVTADATGRAAYRLPANLLGANQPGYHHLAAAALAGDETVGTHQETFYFVDPTQ